MFALKFNGRFELKDPQGFLEDIKPLLEKHSAEYYGMIQTENLGEYVDFQKIEDEPEKESSNE